MLGGKLTPKIRMSGSVLIFRHAFQDSAMANSGLSRAGVRKTGPPRRSAAVRVRRRPEVASARLSERADLDGENDVVAWIDTASPPAHRLPSPRETPASPARSGHDREPHQPQACTPPVWWQVALEADAAAAAVEAHNRSFSVPETAISLGREHGSRNAFNPWSSRTRSSTQLMARFSVGAPSPSVRYPTNRAAFRPILVQLVPIKEGHPLRTEGCGLAHMANPSS